MDHGWGLKTTAAIIFWLFLFGVTMKKSPRLTKLTWLILMPYIYLLFLMVKRRNDFLNPISRQNFANSFAETPNVNLEVRHMVMFTLKLCQVFAQQVFMRDLQESVLAGPRGGGGRGGDAVPKKPVDNFQLCHLWSSAIHAQFSEPNTH